MLSVVGEWSTVVLGSCFLSSKSEVPDDNQGLQWPEHRWDRLHLELGSPGVRDHSPGTGLEERGRQRKFNPYSFSGCYEALPCTGHSERAGGAGRRCMEGSLASCGCKQAAALSGICSLLPTPFP